MIGMMWPRAHLLGAWWRTRRLAARLRSRDDVVRWQGRRLSRWLAEALPGAHYYAARGVRRLEDLPLTDKAEVMAHFDGFNRAGLTREAAWRIFTGEAAAPAGLHVGASTGTSGNRGLYVISEAERYEWLGGILAKVLPRYPFEGARVALVLPQASALYGATNRAPRLALRFFDLNDGLETLAPALRAWRPDTLIAPPKVLRWFAERGGVAGVRRVFSGAEVLDPPDRAVIEATFGVRVREIYMATEGLLGVACAHGTLHLAEDVVHFEFERVGSEGLVSPIISDFTRRTQVMARYRMNDLLRLRQTPCPCGSPLLAVADVVGRADDILSLPAQDGDRMVEITPDILRNAILNSDARISDFRLLQIGRDHLVLHLPAEAAELLPPAVRSLEALLSRLRVGARLTTELGLPPVGAVKIRRVERRFRAE